MAKQQRQWTVQRHLLPTPDGWHRWDRAYQLLMQWANEQQRDHSPQEEQHASSDVCSSLDHAASPDADH
jgi:hypothetical protein